MYILYVITNNNNLWQICEMARNKNSDVVLCKDVDINFLRQNNFDVSCSKDSLIIHNRLTRRSHQIDGKENIIRHIRANQLKMRF